MHAFDYLDKPESVKLQGFCVVFGPERYLQRLVIERLLQDRYGPDAKSTEVARFEGKDAAWRDVRDELETMSLFGGGGGRTVWIDDADEFVSRNRASLERMAEGKRTAALLLQVTSWPANTRLYKLVDQHGQAIQCGLPEKSRGSGPDAVRLARWLRGRAAQIHGVKLSDTGISDLLERVGLQIGILEQELAKLSLFADAQGRVSDEQVRKLAGGWRTQTTWELLDSAAQGDAATALAQLDRLLQSGEHPLALVGALSWSWRRFAAATRIVQAAERNKERIHFPTVLEQAGFRKWPRDALQAAETQLRQLGRARAQQLFARLLELDLALKGSHSQGDRARFALESLLCWMSRANAPVSTGH